MTDEGDVVALDGAAMTPIVLSEPAGSDGGVVLGRGAAMLPMPVDVEPPPRDCASATIVDETRARATTTRGII